MATGSRLLSFFVPAQEFVEHGRLGHRSRTELLAQQFDQFLVVPYRPAPFSQATHQLPVGHGGQSFSTETVAPAVRRLGSVVV